MSKHSNSEVALNVSSLGGKSGTLQGGISSPMGGVNCQQQGGASTAHHGEGGRQQPIEGGLNLPPLVTNIEFGKAGEVEDITNGQEDCLM